MICHQANALLEIVRLGEATDADRAALAAHAADCRDCRPHWEEEEAWRQALERRRIPEPDAEALLRARQQLHHALAQEPAPRPGRWAAWSGNWFGSWPGVWAGARSGSGWSGAWAALLVIVCAGTGFGGGWWAHRAGAAAPAAAPATAQVRVQAVEPNGAGQVRVVYDTVERQTATGAATDPQLRHLLVLAAGQPANAGMQLTSIAALRPAAGQNAVRQTLLAALAGDPNPGVRLEALDALRPLVAADSSVRAALALVVLRDPNPGLRMQAIAALATAPRADAHRWLRQLSVQSSDPYVRLSCVAAMRQLNITPPPAAWAPLNGNAAAAPAPTQQ